GDAGLRVCPCCQLVFETIADAPYSHDILRIAGVRLDLLPQPADMDVDRPGVPDEVIAPHLLEQKVTREGVPFMCDEEGQQIIFLHRQRDLTPPLSQTAARAIEHEIGE